MAVKVVTDSTSDIPAQLVQELGITVVSTYVVFGNKSYRDRIDITEDEIYEKLVHDSVHPTTSIPSPQDFADVYNKLADETDEIISIHLTSKESGVYNSALRGKELVKKKCRIEVVDSQLVAMACGILVIAAAKAARAGANLEQVANEVQQAIPRIHIMILVDTLKYVVRGGRLAKPYGLLGSVLKVRPMLTLREGKLVLTGVARTREKAVQRLFDFVKEFSQVSEIVVSYSTGGDDAEELARRLRAEFPGVPLYLTRIGPVLGTHAGPGAMGVAVREV
jgi:DegV family protein with EDD domain